MSDKKIEVSGGGVWIAFALFVIFFWQGGQEKSLRASIIGALNTYSAEGADQ